MGSLTCSVTYILSQGCDKEVQGYPGLFKVWLLVKSDYLPNDNFFQTSSAAMRTLLVLVLLIVSQVFLAADASQRINYSGLHDLAIAPTWRFAMESTMRSKPTINPCLGEFKLNLKGGNLTGVMKYEYNGNLGSQKAGAKGYFKNQQFVVALSHPDGPLVLKGRFTDANRIEGTATMNGKPYAKFHMNSKSEAGGDPIVFVLDMDPPCVAGSITKLVLDRAAGDVVGSVSTNIPQSVGENSSGVTWFKGGAKGRIYDRQVDLKYIDARGNECALFGNFDSQERAYSGSFRSASVDGYFWMYLDDGTRRFADLATASDWRIEFNPPWVGARVTIKPIVSLDRDSKGSITGSGSYRIGWCGNERPTEVTVDGTWSSNNKVELWIKGPTPIHIRGTFDRSSRKIVGADDTGRTVTMSPVARLREGSSRNRWR